MDVDEARFINDWKMEEIENKNQLGLFKKRIKGEQ